MSIDFDDFSSLLTVPPLACGKTSSLPKGSAANIHRSGTNSSTSSWTDTTERRGKPDAVYRGEETIEANFFCKEVFPY